MAYKHIHTIFNAYNVHLIIVTYYDNVACRGAWWIAHPNDIDSDHTFDRFGVDGLGEDWRGLLGAIVGQWVHFQRSL